MTGALLSRIILENPVVVLRPSQSIIKGHVFKRIHTVPTQASLVVQLLSTHIFASN